MVRARLYICAHKRATRNQMLAGCTRHLLQRDLLQQPCNARRMRTLVPVCHAPHTASQFVPKLATLKSWALTTALKAKRADVGSARTPADAHVSPGAAGTTRTVHAQTCTHPSRQNWRRLAHLALAQHRSLACVIRAWREWCMLWARAKHVRLLTTASGVYCYELPELAVVAAVAVDGASELAHDYCVLKVGMTQCAGGGFLNRLRAEMRDIHKWRDSAELGLEQRLVFLLTGDGACGHERRVLESMGVRIGVAPVDRAASASTLQALAIAGPEPSVQDARCNHPSRLKVQNGWRLWLSARTPRCAVGPSEFLVVHRTVVARLRRQYAERPGALQVDAVLACAVQLGGTPLRSIELDFAHAERSLGKLVFALRNK
jgi:hypothetical protein